MGENSIIRGFFDLHKEGIRVVHAVHDEIVAEVPAKEAESYQKIIENILIKAAKTLCPDDQMRVGGRRFKLCI